MVVVSESPLDDGLENINEVFILIDGLQTPFPVEHLVLTVAGTSANMKLEFVDSQNEALKLVGCEVYSASTHIKKEPEPEAGPEQWIDFAIYDEKYGKTGVIREIENYKGNTVLRVVDRDRETLISLYPELVTGVDSDAKILYIKAPEGYF
jgi:16S rRNA processing protein RimM